MANPAPSIIDAVIIAGGIPKPDEPLYPLTQGKSKALLPIAGQPMVQWIVDALSGSAQVGRIVVVGLAPDDGALTSAKELSYAPNAGSMIGNAEAGIKKILEHNPGADKVVICSSDIPCLTSPMVDWLITTCLATDHDIYYGLISQADMERRFPGSRRSYFAIKEGRFCGSDIIMASTRLLGSYHPAWQEIVGARKNILRQASIIGFGTLWLMLTRQMTMAEAERRAQSQLGIKGRILLDPYAETGMDVDKPRQYELVKHDLETRSPQAPARAAAPTA
jgi:GTP:adenosylcobinamide-phosphate guanylyltransferase